MSDYEMNPETRGALLEAERLQEQVDDLRTQLAAATEERDGLIRECFDVEQALGKALGYPWYKDDPTNFPEATEADGVCVGEHVPGTIAAEAAARLTEAERRATEAEVRAAKAEDSCAEFADALDAAEDAKHKAEARLNRALEDSSIAETGRLRAEGERDRYKALADWWSTSAVEDDPDEDTVSRAEEVAMWLDVVDEIRRNQGLDSTDDMQAEIRDWLARYRSLLTPTDPQSASPREET
jgi:cell division septum initiation protein DivIVA